MPPVSALRNPPGDVPHRTVHVGQGDYIVSSEADVMLSTILGSCVAVCIRDASIGVGGMNHFLLPEQENCQPSEMCRYGTHAMELLINGMLRQGARRGRMDAKLFGGAKMIAGLHDIGESNARFARSFLEAEGIYYSGGSLLGTAARRVQFWPASGRARQMLVQGDLAPKPVMAPVPDGGDVELF